MTFVAYPNISVRSKNRSFRLDISGTPEKNYFRDQSSFVYQLYRGDRLVWEWRAGNVKRGTAFLDDYPHEAWVSDEGWVIVRTHEWFHAGLLVLSPEGQVVLRRLHRRLVEKDEPGFLEMEPMEYMGNSSAGPFWARSAIAYFMHFGDRPLWVIRTWWGCRVIIDLLRAEFLDPAALDEGLPRMHEVGWIEDVLQVGVDSLERESVNVDNPEEHGTNGSVVSRVMTAAYHSGWLQVESAVPYLRRLETMKPLHQSSLGSGHHVASSASRQTVAIAHRP